MDENISSPGGQGPLGNQKEDLCTSLVLCPSQNPAWRGPPLLPASRRQDAG